MKKTFWDKRIPTILGIFLITISVGITTFLVNQGSLFQINASPDQQPQNVRITNVTDSSFSVSYSTEGSVVGSINYGKDISLGQSGLDDRDQESGSLSNHKIHNITVRNLTPLTKYYFTITSGKDAYMSNGKPFEITTGSTLTESPPSQTPITGKVILPSGSAPFEAVIYLTTDNSQVVSVLARSDGSYVLPLNSLRTSDLSSYFSFTENSNITMLMFGDSLTSNILLSIKEISPVPTVTLSNDYDFRTGNTPVINPSSNLQSFPTFQSGSQASGSASPKILTPKKDQEFTDAQPSFKGTALPNEEVQIIIHSDDNIQTKVPVDKNGNWSFRPSTPLTPGNHTITIITKDANGILKSITQSFVVHAEGTQVSQSATPSATLTPTITNAPTPTLTPTPTISGTTITLTPTFSPTPSPTPTEVVQFTPAPTSPLPPTGNNSIITAGIVGVFITLIGGLLFLLSRGGISAL